MFKKCVPSCFIGFHRCYVSLGYALVVRFLAVVLNRRFTKDDVATVTMVKSSTQRGARRNVEETYPACEPYIDDLLPRGEIEEGKWCAEAHCWACVEPSIHLRAPIPLPCVAVRELFLAAKIELISSS